ncbi:MAG: prepilin-type N-terminal cleavage/methylation domain-containing protein [Bryobacteraceae bacterium]
MPTISYSQSSYDVKRMDTVLPVRNRRRPVEGGFSLIELLIVIAIILIILAIALPKFNQARMNTQETAAIRQIGTIHQAEVQYYSQFGRYATTLAELGPPAGGGAAGPSSADLIPATLAQGENTGYVFAIQGSPTGYSVTAVPKSYGSSGRRTFFSDQTLVIHQNWGQEPATTQSPEFKQ